MGVTDHNSLIIGKAVGVLHFIIDKNNFSSASIIRLWKKSNWDQIHRHPSQHPADIRAVCSVKRLILHSGVRCPVLIRLCHLHHMNRLTISYHIAQLVIYPAKVGQSKVLQKKATYLGDRTGYERLALEQGIRIGPLGSVCGKLTFYSQRF